MIFTGYVVKNDYDLNNLKEYKFTKTTPKDINPWWQCMFNKKFNVIITWDCQLLVNRNDRKLYVKYEKGCDMSKLQETVKQMILDNVIEKVIEGDICYV